MTAIAIVSRTMTVNSREAGEAPGRLTWLRNSLTLPGIAMVVVLSRTLNVCAGVLLAYAAVLISTPALRFLTWGRTNVAHTTEDVARVQGGTRDASR
jgi:hypothetical protein